MSAKARVIEQKLASLNQIAPVIDARRGGLGIWHLLRCEACDVERKEGDYTGGKRSMVAGLKMRACSLLAKDPCVYFVIPLQRTGTFDLI